MKLKDYILQEIKEIPDFPKKGIIFKDIVPIFQNPKLVQQIINTKKELYQGKVDAVAGIESRGFLIGLPLALELNVPFVMIRKKGKLPPPVVSQTYKLEYGEATIEVQTEMIQKNQKILIHDDILATGGTALATISLIEKLGASVYGLDFLMEISDLGGKEKLKEYNVESIIN
ncbi:MAG: adenine phosphoribosyltransferase [Flavobacteriales bacterium]|nr:adenine phosphoribosyltransferase [Flavobacteriales bacterium]